jgi:hypothetical protein
MSDALELLPSIALPLTFTAFGLPMLLAALFFARRTRRFTRESSRATGVVVQLVEEYDEGSVTYAPVIRYVADDGVARQFRHHTASRPPAFDVGDRVGILYHRRDRGDARVATTFSLYFITFVFGLVGGVFFGIGVIVPILQLLAVG